MSIMTEEQRSECSDIINIASITAGGVGSGMAQLPCSDAAVIVPIQLGMAVKLGSVFDIDLTRLVLTANAAGGAAKLIGTAVSPFIANLVEQALLQVAQKLAARALSQVLVGWVPFVGNTVNACTAAVITREFGWFLAEEFARHTGDAAYNRGVQKVYR